MGVSGRVLERSPIQLTDNIVAWKDLEQPHHSRRTQFREWDMTSPDPSNSIAINTDESSDHKVESLSKPGQLRMEFITVSLMNINAAYLR